MKLEKTDKKIRKLTEAYLNVVSEDPYWKSLIGRTFFDGIPGATDAQKIYFFEAVKTLPDLIEHIDWLNRRIAYMAERCLELGANNVELKHAIDDDRVPMATYEKAVQNAIQLQQQATRIPDLENRIEDLEAAFEQVLDHINDPELGDRPVRMCRCVKRGKHVLDHPLSEIGEHNHFAPTPWFS